MKRNIPFFLLLLLTLIIGGCCAPDPDNTETQNMYKDFYNYPDGRKSPNGTLEIRNSAASPALLFTGFISPANYIGTVGSLGAIKVRLPEQKFYIIVAVNKTVWEERGDQAVQYNDLIYHSYFQPCSITVSADNTFGGGTWIINNNTGYWVSFRKPDLSGTIYAVAAPYARRVTVPVALNQFFDYIPHYYKELKYQGTVIALVESDVPGEVETVNVTNDSPTFNTDISPPGANIKPSIFVTNSGDRTVRVYMDNEQLTADGMNGADIFLSYGMSQLFTVELGTFTDSINFLSIAWMSKVYVSERIEMKINKVYHIVLSGDADQGYTTTVTEEDMSAYF